LPHLPWDTRRMIDKNEAMLTAIEVVTAWTRDEHDQSPDHCQFNSTRSAIRCSDDR
jgi:hypothetical protein